MRHERCSNCIWFKPTEFPGEELDGWCNDLKVRTDPNDICVNWRGSVEVRNPDYKVDYDSEEYTPIIHGRRREE